MELVITDSQQFKVEIQPVDKAGNPGTLASVPVWSASDPTILTVVPAADGMSAVVSATGKLGTAQVNATGEGDSTPGVNTITGTVAVQVIGGKAVSLQFKVEKATEILLELKQPTLTEDDVRHRAYEFYLKRGTNPGDEVGDWLQAERKLQAK